MKGGYDETKEKETDTIDVSPAAVSGHTDPDPEEEAAQAEQAATGEQKHDDLPF